MKHRVVSERHLTALQAAFEDLEIMVQCLQDVSDEAEEKGRPPLFVLEREQIERTLCAVRETWAVVTPNMLELAPWHLRLRARVFGLACVDYLGDVFAYWYRGELVVVREPAGGFGHE